MSNKCKFKKNVASNLTDLNNFHSLEAVDRVIETRIKTKKVLRTIIRMIMCLCFQVYHIRTDHWTAGTMSM